MTGPLRHVPRVLSIAGTDPTGGAGIHADLKSIAANGGYGMAVVTALVAQNTHGVRSMHVPPTSFLEEQLNAVSDDVEIDAVKIGMLGTAGVIRAVTDWLDRVRPPVVVLDPVMVATSGDRLLDADAEQALSDLLPRVDLVTPNVPELAILSGESPAQTWDEALAQAGRVAQRHGVRVLAKGGHLAGEYLPDALVVAAKGTPGAARAGTPGSAREGTGVAARAGTPVAAPEVTRVGIGDPAGTPVAAPEVTRVGIGDPAGTPVAAPEVTRVGIGDPAGTLGAAFDVTEFAGVRIETRNTHGTGCSLSAALATRVVATGDWATAAAEAKRWLAESIRHGDALAVGTGHGPVSHFAGLWERGGLTTAPTPAEVQTDWWTHIAGIRAEIDDLAFVRGLGDGTLPRDLFLGYLAQDALYLRDYARVLAEAARLAPTSVEQAFWAECAHGAIAGELQLHEGWLSDAALRAARPVTATTAYLDHLLAAGARADYRVLIAALLPCFWIYQDVGERLHRLSHPRHPYRSWLDTYADPAFAASTGQAIDIVTRAAAAAGERTRAAMRDAFRESAAHELAFFAASYPRRVEQVRQDRIASS